MKPIEKLKNWARKLKRQAQILQVVYEDSRTPRKAKILIWITLGYLFSPIDLIPDFIPVLGLLDDLIIVPLLIALVIKLIPTAVFNDAIITIENNPAKKWERNWIVILLICLAWLICIYFAVAWVRRYF